MTHRGTAALLLALAAMLLAGAAISSAASRQSPHVVVKHCGKAHHGCPSASRRSRKRHQAAAKSAHPAPAKPKPKPKPTTTVTTTTTAAATSSAPAPAVSTPATTAPPVVAPVASAPVTATTTTTSTSTSTAVPARVQVTAQEYSYTLSRQSVPAGPVIIELVNAGQDPHNLNAVPAAGGAAVGSFGLTQPGTHVDEQFDFPAGTYTLFCSLPGHAAMGMMATLNVN